MTWIVSGTLLKYHHKLSVRIFKVKVIQGHEVKESSNWKLWVWTAGYMFLGSFSLRTRKMTLEHFLNGRDRTKFENRENVEIAGISVKNVLFRPSKYPNSAIFQDVYMKFCTHIHLTGVFHIHSGFFENSKKIPIFWKYGFCWLFFKRNQDVENLKKSRYLFDKTFILNPLL